MQSQSSNRFQKHAQDVNKFHVLLFQNDALSDNFLYFERRRQIFKPSNYQTLLKKNKIKTNKQTGCLVEKIVYSLFIFTV